MNWYPFWWVFSSAFSDKATGLIVPIYKHKWDKSDLSNYRGNFFGSCLGKLFTDTQNTRLGQFLKCSSILLENQAGFRKKYSNMEHIFLFKSKFEIVIKNWNYIMPSFFIKRHYDTVWPDVLWVKLRNSGIKEDRIVYNILVNMYSERQSFIFLNASILFHIMLF